MPRRGASASGNWEEPLMPRRGASGEREAERGAEGLYDQITLEPRTAPGQDHSAPIHFRSGRRQLLLQLSAPYRAPRTAPSAGSFGGEREGEGHHRPRRRSSADADDPNLDAAAAAARAVAGARWSSGVQCDDVGDIQMVIPSRPERRPELAAGSAFDEDDEGLQSEEEISDEVVEVRVAEDQLIAIDCR